MLIDLEEKRSCSIQFRWNQNEINKKVEVHVNDQSKAMKQNLFSLTTITVYVTTEK